MFKSLKNIWKRARQARKWINDHRQLLLLLLAIVIMLILGGCYAADHHTMLAMVIGGVAGGRHVIDEPITTHITREEAPDLLLNEIDREIVKIRPMATPIDQLSRCAGAKHSGSQIVDYYNVDTKPTSAIVEEDYEEPSAQEVSDDNRRATLHTDNDDIFDVSDTLLVQGTYGYDPDGKASKQELVLYVVGRDSENGLRVQAVNGKKIGDVENCVPSIDADSVLIRMGRAATELDVMSPQFEALPQKARQYCQIFKMQVEESTMHKIADKEVPWTMNDQEEAAIYDMRLGMEKSFLFGVKGKIWDNTKKENVMLTGGIWYQAGKEFRYEGGFTQDSIIDLMREAFTGNAGSKRKILIGGSELIGQLNKLDYNRVITASDTVTKWGIDFTELRSKFGTLYVLLSEVFDECGMESAGMIIDPEYLQKYIHVPFSAETLNLKASGVRNVDATVLTEASCLVLRYPKAHMRIVKA